MRLPDFFIIGAMKAGTTTLWGYLSRHPDVFLCRPKEPAFFSRDEVWGRGMAWYRSLFAGAGEGQVLGEASTCYSRWPAYPLAPERIAAHVPGARFIYIVRHPVDRLYSHYLHEMRLLAPATRGRLPSFEQFVESDREAFPAGLYEVQAARYRAWFGADRLLLVLLEDLVTAPGEVLTRVQDHLGVARADLEAAGQLRLGDRSSRVRKGAASRSMDRVRRASLARPLIDSLPVEMRREVRRRVTDALSRSRWGEAEEQRFRSRLSGMGAGTRADLLARYGSTVDAVESMVGRRLDAWRR